MKRVKIICRLKFIFSERSCETIHTMGRGGGAVSPSAYGRHAIPHVASGDPVGEVKAVHIVALTLVQLFYAGYHVICKVALGEGVHKFVFSAYRDCIAVVSLFAFELLFGAWTRRQGDARGVRDSSSIGKPYTSKQSKTQPPWKALCFLSLTGVFLNQLFFLQGLARVSPVIAAALQLCIPVFTWIIAVCFTKSEKISLNTSQGRWKLGGVFLCAAGALLVSFVKIRVAAIGWADDESDGVGAISRVVGVRADRGGGVGAISRERGESETQVGGHHTSENEILGSNRDRNRRLIGVLFLLGNTTCMALYLTAQRKVLNKYPHPRDVTRWTYVMGSAMMLLGAVFEVPPWEQYGNGVTSGVTNHPWVLTNSELVGVVYGGVVASGFNYSAMTWVNLKVGPGVVSMFLPLQPAFGALLSWLVLGESVFWGTVLGGVVITAGLASLTKGTSAGGEAREVRNTLSVSSPEIRDGVATSAAKQNTGGALPRHTSTDRFS
jgi:drug/metabolite transporter (DMT)-like permease